MFSGFLEVNDVNLMDIDVFVYIQKGLGKWLKKI